MLNEPNTITTSTQLAYTRRLVTSEDVQQQVECFFELSVADRIALPNYVRVRFQRKDRLINQVLNNGCFHRPAVPFAQGIVRAEKYPDAGIISDFSQDNFSHSYS